jgi:hypothetical protein
MKTHKVGQDLVFTASRKFTKRLMSQSRRNWIALRENLTFNQEISTHDFIKHTRAKTGLPTNYRFIWLSTALIISYFISQSFLIFMTQ